MKNLHVLTGLLFVFTLAAFILFISITCSAQVFAPYPAFFPFVLPAPQLFNPYTFPPLVPPTPAINTSIFAPALSPYIASIPTMSRSAAATIIILPPTPPQVTAYAPLGTLTLTPSTLIFLILFLTLPE